MVNPSEQATEMSLADLERMRRHYRIPQDILLTLPAPDDRVTTELPEGVFCYEESLKAGLRFPFHPFVREVMKFYNICPSMVAPNSWRHLVGFISLCNRVGVTATLPIFRVCYNLVSGRASEWPYISPRRSFKMITDNPSSIKEWKSRFFIVEGGIGSDFPRKWGPYNKDPEARPDLSEQERRDLDVLRSGPPTSASILLSEDALFAAGLSLADPRDDRSAFVGGVREKLHKRERGSSSGRSQRSGKRARFSSPSFGDSEGGKDVRRASPMGDEGDEALVAARLTPGSVVDRSVPGVVEEIVEVSPSSIVVLSDDGGGAEEDLAGAPEAPAEPPTGSAAAPLEEVRFADPAAEPSADPTEEPSSEEALMEELFAGVPIIEETPAEASASAAPRAEVSDVPEEADVWGEPAEGEGRREEGEPESSGGGDIRGGVPAVQIEVSEASRVRALVEEAHSIAVPQVGGPGYARFGVNPYLSDLEIDAKFVDLIRSAFRRDEGPSSSGDCPEDLVEAAFRFTGVPNEAFLLGGISDITLGRIAFEHSSRASLATRALNWRLHLAVEAWGQARSEVNRLEERLRSLDGLSSALVQSNALLASERGRLETAQERISRLSDEVRRLEGLREQLDKAREELAANKAEFDNKIRAAEGHFEKRWDKLKAIHTAEKDALSKRLSDAEQVRSRQRDQLDILHSELAGAIKRRDELQVVCDGVTLELDAAAADIGDKQSRLDELYADFRRVQAEKSKALSRVHEMGTELAKRSERMRKLEADFQDKMSSFGRDMAAHRRERSELSQKLVDADAQNSELGRRLAESEARSSELGRKLTEAETRDSEQRGRLAEAEARASSAVEEYKRSAEFLEDRQEACADAFHYCEEDLRARIHQAHPEWNLSFLDAGLAGSRTPGTDDTMYEDASDVDLEAVLGPRGAPAPGGDVQDVQDSVGGTSSPRRDEMSRASPGVAEKETRTVSSPDP